MKIDKENAFIAAVLVIITSLAGSYFTNQGIRTKWYESIKSHVTLIPPSIVFPIVWTTLYVLIAISIYRALCSKHQRSLVLSLYAINLVMNVVWCYLFFSKQNPQGALIIMMLILFSTIALIAIQQNWLLLPYLVWLLYASLINYQATKV